MEREQKRQRKGSSLACSRASWQLPSELLCLVFGFLSWRDYPSLSAVNKEWWAAGQTPLVQQAMALAAEREHLFFPKGFLQARIPREEQWRFFMESMVPILRDFGLLLSCLRASSSLPVDPKVVESFVDVVTAIKTCYTDGPSACGHRYSHVGARPQEFVRDEMAQRAKEHHVAACLCCGEEAVQRSMGAFQVLPSKGTLYFLVQSGHECEQCLVLFDDEEDKDGAEENEEEERPTRRWQALGETEGEAPQPERFQCLTDCLWLSQEAMAALSLEEEDWEKAMDAWEEARDSAFPFFPGQHPYYCRLGGRDGYNGVGEVLVPKEEAILLEAGHMSGSGVWCSWNVYAAKEVIRSCAAAFSGCGRGYAAPGVVRCSYMELW